jgi:hypothetical protein
MPHPQHVTDYRPLTLLNTDFKILTRIVANHLEPILPNILENNQYCETTGSAIIDALATIRDTTAYAEETKTSMCSLPRL